MNTKYDLQLTKGEYELIKAIRAAGGIHKTFEYKKTTLVAKDRFGEGLSYGCHIAFLTKIDTDDIEECDNADKNIIAALNQISREY